MSPPSQDHHIEAVTQIIQKQKQENQRLLQQQQEQQDHQRRILQQQLQQEQQRLQQQKEKSELLQKQQMQAKQRYQFEEQKKMQDKLPLQQKEPQQQRYQSSQNNQEHEKKLQWTKPKTVTTTTLVEAVRNRQLCGVVTTEPAKSGQLTMTVHCSGPAFSDDSSVSYTESVVEGMLFQVWFYVLPKRKELTCSVSL